MSLKDSMIEWGKTVNLGAEEVQPLIDIVESAMEDVKAKTEADATAAATEAFLLQVGHFSRNLCCSLKT